MLTRSPSTCGMELRAAIRQEFDLERMRAVAECGHGASFGGTHQSRWTGYGIERRVGAPMIGMPSTIAWAIRSRSKGSLLCGARPSTAVACSREIGSSSKLFRAISRCRSGRLRLAEVEFAESVLDGNFPAGRDAYELGDGPGSSINALAVRLSWGSFQKNRSMACVSRSPSLNPSTPGSLPGGRRNRGPSGGACPGHSLPCRATCRGTDPGHVVLDRLAVLREDESLSGAQPGDELAQGLRNVVEVQRRHDSSSRSRLAPF